MTIVAVPGVVTMGTPGDDVILGTQGNDVVRGLSGRDRICGLGGADRIIGGGGGDRIAGGAGDDTIIGGGGRDRILGNDGGDSIRGGPGRDVLARRSRRRHDHRPGRRRRHERQRRRRRLHCRSWQRQDATLQRGAGRHLLEVARLEARMVDQINQLRRSVGVAPLRASPPIADVARRWSSGLPSSFRHNPAVASQIPAGWRLWAENIGYRVDPSRSLVETMDAVQRALVASPGHYANLTHPDLTHVGVGIHIQGDGVYVTQVFARY